jgi:predicted metal-dependent hydrolase
MTTPTDVAVIPRDVHFRTDSAHGTAWLGADPVATAVFNALSQTFPDGERLFIDSVRVFRDRRRASWPTRCGRSSPRKRCTRGSTRP